MKKILAAMLCVILCLSLVGCGGDSSANYKVGDKVEVDGISFTLHGFDFAMAVNNDTYMPETAGENSWTLENNAFFAYLNYTIENNSDATLDHFADVEVYIVDNNVSKEAEAGTFGSGLGDHRASCEEADKYDLRIDPAAKKEYHHVISGCTRSLVDAGADLKIVVEINSTKFTYVIPADQLAVPEDYPEDV